MLPFFFSSFPFTILYSHNRQAPQSLSVCHKCDRTLHKRNLSDLKVRFSSYNRTHGYFITALVTADGKCNAVTKHLLVF